MINRRGALVALGAAAISAVPSSSALVRLLQSGIAQTQDPASETPSKDAANDAVDDRLRQDLAQLAHRAYSEEGVLVFLACEDLVAGKTSQKSAVTLTVFNTTLASDFRKNAAAWQRIHPDAADTDVAKVIELLADRDFTNRTEQKQ